MKPTPQMLEEILADVRPMISQGQVADYIPALAKVPQNKLGMAVWYHDDDLITAGDAEEPFSIQSISKVLSLTLALQHYPADQIWQRVGKEPSGLAFNSIIQLDMERGIPRNPYMNAGALVVCDLITSAVTKPRQHMLDFVRELSGDPSVTYDGVVARSEMEHSDRNASIAYLMKSFGNFENDVLTVLVNYFHYCSLRMSCVDLARTFSYLANKGKPSGSGKRILSEIQTKQVNALLSTCGLYDRAGEFAYRVGMPGKSGVGGGIVAVVPGEMSIATWSPALGPSGNSVAGVFALERLSNRIGRSIF